MTRRIARIRARQRGGPDEVVPRVPWVARGFPDAPNLHPALVGRRPVPKVAAEGAAKVWLYDGPSAWHFLTLPKGLGEQLKMLTAGRRQGWGSIRVEATIGATTWRTSVFPDSTSGSFVLPIKKEVRDAERIAAGDSVRFRLSIEA